MIGGVFSDGCLKVWEEVIDAGGIIFLLILFDFKSCVLQRGFLC